MSTTKSSNERNLLHGEFSELQSFFGIFLVLKYYMILTLFTAHMVSHLEYAARQRFVCFTV